MCSENLECPQVDMPEEIRKLIEEGKQDDPRVVAFTQNKLLGMFEAQSPEAK